MEKNNKISFADLALERRKIKEDFFNQINKLVNWSPIEKEINKCYKKGESATGRPSYSGIVLFKMTLLQTWYGLSDYELEDQVNDRVSFSRFVGIPMDESVPDHSVISRFRTELTKKKAYQRILKQLNKQLEEHKILIKTGILVDASISDTPRQPRGKKEFEVVQDREEDQNQDPSQQIEKSELKEKVKSGVDTEARWVKKAGKLHYGYKKHTATNQEGLILSIVTTPANESDIKHFEDVLDLIEIEEYTPVMADKGYKSADNDFVLEKKKLKNRIMHKANKNKALSVHQIKFNKLISKVRYKVERTFGSIKRWFSGGVARYVGIDKMHSQHLLEAIAYNLYRSPGIIMSNCEK